jgi:hypothetical protein
MEEAAQCMLVVIDVLAFARVDNPVITTASREYLAAEGFDSIYPVKNVSIVSAKF